MHHLNKGYIRSEQKSNPVGLGTDDTPFGKVTVADSLISVVGGTMYVTAATVAKGRMWS